AIWLSATFACSVRSAAPAAKLMLGPRVSLGPEDAGGLAASWGATADGAGIAIGEGSAGRTAGAEAGLVDGSGAVVVGATAGTAGAAGAASGAGCGPFSASCGGKAALLVLATVAGARSLRPASFRMN